MSSSFYDRFSNSRLYDLGDKLGDIMLLSLCWLLCSLPVVTLGASSTALYYAIHRRFTKESSTPVQDFFRSFKRNLLQGIILNVILMIYGGLTAFNIYFAFCGWNGVHLPSFYIPVSILLALPFLFSALYVFPYLARFSNSVGSTLFHSFTFSTMYAGHTIRMWIFVILSVVLMVLFFPSVLVVPFICCYLCWKLCERDFSYALLLRDKREHPENYQEESKGGEEESSDEELSDDGEEEDESEDEEVEDAAQEDLSEDEEEESDADTVDEETSEE